MSEDKTTAPADPLEGLTAAIRRSLDDDTLAAMLRQYRDRHPDEALRSMISQMIEVRLHMGLPPNGPLSNVLMWVHEKKTKNELIAEVSRAVTLLTERGLALGVHSGSGMEAHVREVIRQYDALEADLETERARAEKAEAERDAARAQVAELRNFVDEAVRGKLLVVVDYGDGHRLDTYAVARAVLARTADGSGGNTSG